MRARVAPPRRGALAALALLLLSALPAAAQVSFCENEPEFPEFRVFCYTNRAFWNVVAGSDANDGRFFVDFNDFLQDTPFADLPPNPFPFALGVENGPFCPPGNPLCKANYVDVFSSPPIDPTINLSPYARAIVDCAPASSGDRTCGADSITLLLSFDPQLRLRAFGAAFARANTGEGLDLELILSNGSSTFVEVAPIQSGDEFLQGFFGIFIDDFGNDLFLEQIRFVPRNHLPDTAQGKVGEKFGMDNLGNTPQCQDGLDNDGDGDTDFPEDAGCTEVNDLSEAFDCSDGIDNDLDGDTDFPEESAAECRDADDTSEGIDCDDDVDNDRDGRVDFADNATVGDPGCSSIADTDERDPDLRCDDGIDNDCDGFSDFGPGGDPGCSFLVGVDVPETPPTPGMPFGSERDDEVVCDNGLDDDMDGFRDFASDPTCVPQEAAEDLGLVGDPGCSAPGDGSEGFDCGDGVDNDSDGDTDTDDADCRDAADPSEVPDCVDSIDNDLDGDTDFLADADCLGAIDQSEVPDCQDGFDNDGDGLTDLDDGGCADDPDDQTEDVDCDDGVDNDGDGLIDSADPGCVDANDDREISDVLVCDDGVDNDGDGLTDVDVDPEVDDPGCADSEDGSELDFGVQCDNGQDDDMDGGIDIGGGGLGGPGDAECASALDVSELQTCADGFDNDFDGLIDFPFDGGCASADDDDESVDCGPGGFDLDGDGVCDRDDNCLVVFNRAPQADTNQNGLGNACDVDYDNDGTVGAFDFIRFRAAFLSQSGDPRYDPDVDTDCDGVIGSLDFNAFRGRFGLLVREFSGCLVLSGGCTIAPEQLSCPAP